MNEKQKQFICMYLVEYCFFEFTEFNHHSPQPTPPPKRTTVLVAGCRNGYRYRLHLPTYRYIFIFIGIINMYYVPLQWTWNRREKIQISNYVQKYKINKCNRGTITYTYNYKQLHKSPAPDQFFCNPFLMWAN